MYTVHIFNIQTKNSVIKHLDEERVIKIIESCDIFGFGEEITIENRKCKYTFEREPGIINLIRLHAVPNY